MKSTLSIMLIELSTKQAEKIIELTYTLQRLCALRDEDYVTLRMLRDKIMTTQAQND